MTLAQYLISRRKEMTRAERDAIDLRHLAALSRAASREGDILTAMNCDTAIAAINRRA
jgi:hypothetical protein